MTDMPTLAEIQETFSLVDDWEERYAYLIDLGRKLPCFPENERHDNNIVKGCTSRVWMISDIRDGRVYIKADSDAHIVRGLIALVLAVYNGKTVAEIKTTDMHAIFEDLGLSEHLSPNRRNGFFAMVARISSL